jgi:LysM repeat protein
MIKIGLVAISFFFFAGLSAQKSSGKLTRGEYIQLYKDIAIEEMNAYHIPASITLAQGILESGNGNSTLARKANNHFGIKCHKGWNGKTYHMDDDEKNECFRKYPDPHESFKDHSIFLSTRNRYAFLFNLEINDYKGWAHGLKQAGYATNPNYPRLLIKLIEENQLYQYDEYYQRQSLAAISKYPRNIKPDSREDFNAITIGADNREVYENNGIKFIRAREGDSFYQIAQDFSIYTWQVYKYNDLKKKSTISEGQVLYLEKKKNKGPKAMHIVEPGETLHDISQAYGVKLKKLCKYNTLDKDARLYPNQEVRLRK